MILLRDRIGTHLFRTRGDPFGFGTEAGFRWAMAGFGAYMVGTAVLNVMADLRFNPLSVAVAVVGFIGGINSHRFGAREGDLTRGKHIRLVQRQQFFLAAVVCVVGVLSSCGLVHLR